MEYVLKFFAIVIGSLFIAVGINFFLVPFQVLDGGMIGISLILNYIWDTKIGLMMIIFSLPVFIISFIYHREYFYESITGMLVSALIIDLLAPFQYYFLYYIELTSFTSSVVGGALVGTGIGFMLRHKTSTGGTDLIAQFLAKWVPLNVGLLIFMIDGIIIGVGGLLFSLETFYNSLLTISAGGITTSLLTFKGRS
ncbi:MAG: YitT family protein [Paenibacillaceae bacterium]